MFAFIWAIVIGFIVGLIAKAIMPGRDPGGFIVTVLLGIGGALLATWLGQAVGGTRRTSELASSAPSWAPSSFWDCIASSSEIARYEGELPSRFLAAPVSLHLPGRGRHGAIA